MSWLESLTISQKRLKQNAFVSEAKQSHILFRDYQAITTSLGGVGFIQDHAEDHDLTTPPDNKYNPYQ